MYADVINIPVISIKLIGSIDNSIFFLVRLIVYLQQVVNLMG